MQNVNDIITKIDNVIELKKESIKMLNQLKMTFIAIEIFDVNMDNIYTVSVIGDKEIAVLQLRTKDGNIKKIDIKKVDKEYRYFLYGFRNAGNNIYE